MVKTNSLTKQPHTRPDTEPAGPAPAADQNQAPVIILNGRIFSCPFGDLLPPLDNDEDIDLHQNIEAHGVLTPVLVTDHDEVIDGHNRLWIAASLGLTKVPIKVKRGLTAEEARRLAVALNVHRRHLGREQRRELIARLLKADPSQSNAVIGEATKADRKTVVAVRQEMEETGEVPKLDATKGKDGKVRPRRNKTSLADTTAPAPALPVSGSTAATEPDLETDAEDEVSDRHPDPSDAPVLAVPGGRRAERLVALGYALGDLAFEIRCSYPEMRKEWSSALLRDLVDQVRGVADKLDELNARVNRSRPGVLRI